MSYTIHNFFSGMSELKNETYWFMKNRTVLLEENKKPVNIGSEKELPLKNEM